MDPSTLVGLLATVAIGVVGYLLKFLLTDMQDDIKKNRESFSAVYGKIESAQDQFIQRPEFEAVVRRLDESTAEIKTSIQHIEEMMRKAG